MDVFALLFIVSFLVLIFTLVVMHIRKCMNKGKGDVVVPLSQKISISKERFKEIGLHQLNRYSRSYDLESSMMQREVNETQEKWKETLPKHSTRIKLRNSRKLRNKRKGKKYE